MRRAWMGTSLAAAVAATLALAPAVGAVDLALPTDTVIYAEPGTLIELGRVPVNTEIAGPQCTWEASATNQNSAHPGNDIIVRSGETELVLSEVEATAGKVTTNSGSVYLVDEVVVSLRMGPDGVFSGGLDLTIRYDQCTTSTTLPTTTIPTTTLPVPTTDGALEPLGPSVTTTATLTTATLTTATPTTVELAPAGPSLPVTGGSRTEPLLVAGLALVGLGTAAAVMTRRSARLR